MNTYLEQRQMMVERQIRMRGVTDQTVLDAMMAVPRELFMAEMERENSYHDGPMPIGYGQTISQPYIVAYMTEKLELTGKEKILELGTGSGYQTAVLAEIGGDIYTVEVVDALAHQAQHLLTHTLNYSNIHFKCENGRDGWPEYAPFDRILMTAAPRQFPELLFQQLAEGGVALAPVGDYFQQIVRYRKMENKIVSENLIAVAFVPFI